MKKGLATATVVAILFSLLALTLPVAGQVVDDNVCPEGDGWVKADGLSGLTYTFTPPDGFVVIENCMKVGNHPPLFGTGNTVTNTTLFNSPMGAVCTAPGVPVEGCALQGISHASFLLAPVTTTTEPTTTEPTTTTTTSTTTTTTTTTTMPTTTTTEPGSGDTTTTTTLVPTPTQFCVDLNTAPQAQLEQLGGVSPLIALIIIAGRPYNTVTELAVEAPILALILAVNAQTGAFASDTCLTQQGTTSTTLPGTPTTTVPGSTTAPPTTAPPTTVPVTIAPGVRIGGVTAVCVSDIPYFAYNVAFAGATIINEIRFDNPSGPDVVYTNQPLSGQVLWPGASENPDDWPGWSLVGGVWVEADDGFLWARQSVTVIFTINPTATVTVNYPPASAICASPQNAAIAPIVVSPTNPVVGSLPYTGADFAGIGFLAGAISLLGLLILTSVRKGRADTE